MTRKEPSKRMDALVTACLDPTTPGPDRDRLMEYAFTVADKESRSHLVHRMVEKRREYEDRVQDLAKGPLRAARVVSLGDRVLVRAPDGTEAVCRMADDTLAAELKVGDRVVVDAGGQFIHARLDHPGNAGETGKLERRVNGTQVEVSLRGEDTRTVDLSYSLQAKLDRGEVPMGSKVIVSDKMALEVLAPADGFSHYEYLDRRPLPDVVVSRDIANPPGCVQTILDHMRGETYYPAVRRRWGLRRSISCMLVGASGTGKTLTLDGIIREAHVILSEFTQLPIAQLYPRVVRITSHQFLNPLLGMSDKALARAFQETFDLYDKPVTLPNGENVHLPVICIAEEIDGWARKREGGTGFADNHAHDRILTTALQKMDLNNRDHQNRVIIYLSSSNFPDAVDAAYFRRAGGIVERFGRLTQRRAFRAVLERHLRGKPFRGAPQGLEAGAMNGVLEQIASRFFSAADSAADVLELRFAGGEPPARRGVRDFFTGAVISQAVQRCVHEGCRLEQQGCAEPGLTADMVIAELEHQVADLVKQVRESNAGDYVDLPTEGMRVASVRILRMPGEH